MSGGGGELVAGSPTLVQYFEICKDFVGQTHSQAMPLRPARTQRSTRVYINFTQQGETTEKKLSPSAYLGA